MEIGNGKGPSLSQLSTMAPHSFVIDDVRCTSLESLLQALKFDKASLAASIAADKPKSAKERGKKNFNWAHAGTCFWKGQPIERDSAEHARFVDRVIQELISQSPVFCKALKDTADLVLTAPGKSLQSQSPITELEYCRALTKARGRLLSRQVLAGT